MGRTMYQASRHPDPGNAQGSIDKTVLEHCTVPERRATLEVLCERDAPSLESLAADVADRVTVATGDETVATDRVAIRLYHNHLQHMSEDDIVAIEDDNVVTLTAAVSPDRIRDLVVLGRGDWDALDAILTKDRRRRVVEALSVEQGPVSMDDLADAVAASEDCRVDGPSSAVDSARVSLHHVDLPKLAAVGVVDYDPDGGRVELESLPDAYVDRLAREPLSA